MSRSLAQKPAQKLAQKLERRLTGVPAEPAGDPVRAMYRGIPVLARALKPRETRRLARQKLALAEAPFDRHLLAASDLYRRSRALYLTQGGTFRAALVSSPRTLSSSILLENVIEYSPTERELVWAATDPAQRRDSARTNHLLAIRTYSVALMHEQSHRLLWRFLPPCPRDAAGCRRYLNFAESLVIATDMALGDRIGGRLASLLYWSGVIYDAGTATGRKAAQTRRLYRNYLHAALLATYLHLEFFDAKDIRHAIPKLFPSLGKLADLATRRALTLDRDFVEYTNPKWQQIHGRAAARALSREAGEPLSLPERAADNRLQYLWAERWFERMGI